MRYELAATASILCSLGCGGSGNGMTSATLASVALNASSDSAYEFGTPVVLAAQPKDQSGTDLALPGSATTYHAEPAGMVTIDADGKVLVMSGARGSVSVSASVTAGSTTVESNAVTLTVDVAAGSASVVTSGDSFVPSRVDIKVGGTVSWSGLLPDHNVDFVNATPFRGKATTGLPGSVSSASTSFGAAGSYLFHCDVHGSGSPGPPPMVAGMSGTIVVH